MLVAIGAFVLMCAGGMAGAGARAVLGLESGSRTKPRVSRGLLLCLLIGVCLVAPALLGVTIRNEWRSSRESGWFVAVTDLKSGSLVEDLRPPLSQGEFVAATGINRENVRREITDSLREIRGQPAIRSEVSDPWSGSDLIERRADPAIADTISNSSLRQEDWIRAIRKSSMDEFAASADLKVAADADLVMRLHDITSLSEPLIRSNLEGATRIAKLMEIDRIGWYPPPVDPLTAGILYLGWDDWYEREPSLRWLPLSVSLSGLFAVALSLGWSVSSRGGRQESHLEA
jgi:hypothetical protein